MVQLKFKKINEITNLLDQIDIHKSLHEDVHLKKIACNLYNKGVFKKYIYSINLIKDTFKNIYHALMWHPAPLINYKFNNKKQNILFIETHNRADLLIDTNFYKYGLFNMHAINLSLNQKKLLNFGPIISIIIIILKMQKKMNLNLLMEGYIFRRIHSIFYLTEILKNLCKIYTLYEIIIKKEVVIAFQEMCPVENLICQLSNELGIKTIALCHAIGSEKKYLGLGEENYEISSMYIASICSYVFCWGSYHKELYLKYTKSDVRIVGKPYIEEFYMPSEGILFIFDYDKEANKRLIQIAEEINHIGIPVSYWFKPTSEFSDNFVRRNGPPRKFVLGEKSSLLLAMGIRGFSVFVLEGSHLSNLIGEDYTIKNSSQLRRAYENDYKYDHKIWRQFISETGESFFKEFNRELNTVIENGIL